MNLADRHSHHQILFSAEGRKDLLCYHKQIKEALQHVVTALAAHDPILANKCLARQEELKRLEQEFHLRHIRELRTGIVNNIKSSAIYLDLLDAMSTVLSHIFDMAYALREANNISSTSPLLSQRTDQFKVLNTQQLRSVSQVKLTQGTSHISSTGSLQSLRTGQFKAMDSCQWPPASQTDLAKR